MGGGGLADPHVLYVPLLKSKNCPPPIFVDHDKNFCRYVFNFCMTKANLTSIYDKFKDANFTVLMKYQSNNN